MNPIPSNSSTKQERAAVKRFDALALYSSLDAERKRRGLTWTDVAWETGVSETTIRRCKSGGRMEVDGVLALTGGLGKPVEAFVREA